ncbi:MAG TPA: hypothetical protein PK351_10235 [Spirochaetota bacterium]|nr:hypothetical protein [Spirochaetota bacterium]HPP05187.1 hypothetical protein [Spirochaetota bacterium]
MPVITFSSNKMFFHGYKYGPEQNDPTSKYKWYEFDVTADCDIDMNNKTISLSNIEVSDNLPSHITLEKGIDYPAVDTYSFEIVNNSYLVFPWQDNNLYYLEKQ